MCARGTRTIFHTRTPCWSLFTIRIKIDVGCRRKNVHDTFECKRLVGRFLTRNQDSNGIVDVKMYGTFCVQLSIKGEEQQQLGGEVQGGRLIIHLAWRTRKELFESVDVRLL